MDNDPNISGLLVVSSSGETMFSAGKGQDSRIKAMVSDADWMAEALRRRVVPILFSDERFSAVCANAGEFRFIVIFAEVGETAMRFLLGVDFAWDIIEHILTDNYDAMVVADTNDTLAFVSPVHEKFLGLKPGEGIGRRTRDVISDSRLHHVVRTGVAEIGQVLKMKSGHRIVSRHPIRHNGEIVGAIGRVMFKGPQQLEEMASRIHDLESKVAKYELEAREEERGERFLEAIVGKSFAIEAVRQQIRKIAPLDVPVLIQGESGTGKELVASALHMMSARRHGRLVTVNAAALPANLVESELFGYEAGSFTGADRKGRPGKFELADRGTIFLDEIGDMPIEVQSKLLRVLQDRVVERVGGERPKHVDFRLCSATNHNLEALVEENRFRLDLFYRISPVRIVVPSLAERVDDIPLLMHHFVSEFSEKYGYPMPEVDSRLPDYLMSRNWPGNIRQLRHEIERAFVFMENGILKVENFQIAAAVLPGGIPSRSVIKSTSGTGDGMTMKDAVEKLEGDLIADAMVRYKGNKKKVAERLGISRSYLYKRLNIDELEDAE